MVDLGSLPANRQWRIASVPSGELRPENFRYHEEPVRWPEDGEVLLKTHYLSLAPVMRFYMTGESRTGDRRLGVGDIIHGRGVAEVIESRHPDFAIGDFVHGQMGWQTYKTTKVAPIERFRKMRKTGLPAYLGITALGFSGFSAYCGYVACGDPRLGDRVLVSAAAGGVGHLVVQFAQAAGASQVVGIAGGPEKARILLELGCDAAIDYKSEDLAQRIAELFPDGIDLYFDNVGGPTLEAVLENLAMDARIVLCGSISEYVGSSRGGPANYTRLRAKRAKMMGFFVYNHEDMFDRAERNIATMIQQGQVLPKHTIHQGFEQMPSALIGLFEGTNIGKQIVRVEGDTDLIC